MKFLLREPLVHFLLIGGALFLLFQAFNDPVGQQSGRIVISNGEIEFLKASFVRTRQRQPTQQELQGLISGYVREEVLYREALALGLEKNDPVIRRRLRQKLELMSDDIAGVTVPSEEELRRFMEERPESFRNEQQVAFRQIFIDVAQRGISAEDEAARLLALLSNAEIKPDPDTLGDSLMLPKTFPLSPVSDIAKKFGKPFSLELVNVEPEQWSGPVQSGYGLHLIQVTEKIPGRFPKLDEIKETVEWEWTEAHQKELRENIYKEIRQKYTIDFEQPTDKGGSFQAISMAQAAQEERK